MKTKHTKKPLTVLLNRKTLATLEKEAAGELRSRSNFAAALILQGLEELKESRRRNRRKVAKKLAKTGNPPAQNKLSKEG